MGLGKCKVIRQTVVRKPQLRVLIAPMIALLTKCPEPFKPHWNSFGTAECHEP